MKSSDLRPIVKLIQAKQDEVPAERSMLAGISGIDGSGKGYITAQLASELRKLKVAVINVDGWLNLPHVRFNKDDPGRHFYEHALRLDEMFEELILPLKRDRSIRLTAELAKETATEFHKHEYNFENIDVILLEGIFLFKKKYVRHFDMKVWVECSFETALRRAIERSQEGLGELETVTAYEKTYFPAQRLHFRKDQPQLTVDLFLNNNAAFDAGGTLALQSKK